MDVIKSIRLYHLVLAALALAAYYSDELRHVHVYIGYSVSAVIVFRLLWSLKPETQLKLSRFIPSFKDIHKNNFLSHPATGRVILLILSLSIVGAAGTGIALDKGRALGLGEQRPRQTEGTVQRQAGPPGEHGPRGHRREKGPMAEAHEFFANTFILFAVLHAVYLWRYRRPMAKFMLFMDKAKG